MRSALLLCLLLCPGLAGHRAGPIEAPDGQRHGRSDLAEALSALSADAAEERRLAQRWLARHVRPGDFGALAAAARDGDLEVRSRIAGALGTDGRNLGLVALFAAEDQPHLRDVGESALGDLLLAWNPDLEQCREVTTGVEYQLREAGLELPEELMRLDLGGVLGDVVDRLLRVGASGVPVVVDTDVDELRFTRVARDTSGRAVFEGTWLDLLMLSARLRNLDLEAVGLPEGTGLPAFLRFSTARSAGRQTGPELFSRWCRELVGGHTEAKRMRAARAIASTGWPAGILMLDERWTEEGDRAALEGLLLAAGRGRVAPFLSDPRQVSSLLRDVDKVLSVAHPAEGDLRRAQATQYALANLSSLGRGGVDLCELLLHETEGSLSAGRAANDPALRPAQLWFRLAVVGRQASASPRVRAVVAGLLEAPPGTYPGPVLRQALATWVALPPPRDGRAAPTALQIGDLAGLLGRPGAGAGARRLVEDLIRSGAPPPAALLPGPAPGAAERERVEATLSGLVVFEWNLGVGRVEAAADVAAALGALSPGWPPPLPAGPLERDAAGELAPVVEAHRLQGALGEILRRWAGLGQAPRVLELIQALRVREAAGGPPRKPGDPAVERGGGRPAASDRLALLAGLIEPEPRARVLAFALGAEGAGDRAALGALAGLPGGEEAREALLEAYRLGTSSGARGLRAAELGLALTRAHSELRARGADGLALELHGRALGIARENPSSPLAAGVLDPRWPPAPGARPDDLDALDSLLGRVLDAR